MSGYTQAERRAMPAADFAGPHRSYPIHVPGDVADAWSLAGHAGDPEAVRRRIVEICRRKGEAFMSALRGMAAAREWMEAHGMMAGGGVAREAEPETLTIREAGVGLVAAAESGAADFGVVLIREGQAKSGRYFSRRAVEDVARLAEGARAFADHPTVEDDRLRPVRSVRDVVGVYRDVSVREGSGEYAGRAEAVGTLRLFEHAGWLAAMAREGLSVGREVVGLSIDSLAQVRAAELPPGSGRRVPVVESVPELRSVDVVTRPSAGGAFLSVREAEMVAEVETKTEVGPEAGAGGAVAAVAGVDDRVVVREAEALLAQVREARLVMECQRALDEHLAAATSLPAPVQAKVRRQWAYEPGRYADLAGYARALEAGIALEVETLGPLRDAWLAGEGGAARKGAGAGAGAGSGLVTGMGAARVDVSAVERQRLVAQLAMDRFFGVRESDDDVDLRRAKELGVVLSGLPRWWGIREAYVALTGDSEVRGQLNAQLSIVREANEVTTTVMNDSVMNAMTKKLIQDYAGQPAEWRKICQVVPVRDFKVQNRIAANDFAALSTVVEGGTYQNLAWGDRLETYTPAKRGNLVVITREMILNDDVQVVRRIPSKLAIAAGITMNEFVWTTLITANPNFVSDGVAVFNAAHGSNTGTTALSSAAVSAATAVMLKQTNSASKRIGVRPRYLCVPPDLWNTAVVISESPGIPGSNNNDPNVFRGWLRPVIVPQFTDVNDWYLFSDPAEMPTIEIGFVQGRETPELLAQDNPTAGSVFTNDQISYKVRWEWGGGWLDYRGAYQSVVA